MREPGWLGAPEPDYLGPDWRQRKISLYQDDGGARGPEFAVLVHEADAPDFIALNGIAALWLPGFVDSFFHLEQAQAWRDAGVALVGLDMRRSARSLVHNNRDDLRDLRVRNEEVTRAISVLRMWGAKKVVLIGHSTGGLQAAIYAADHPRTVDAIILNSPWFEHNGSRLQKGLLTKVLDRVGKYMPRLWVSYLDAPYARSLHKDFGGEFEFNTEHKPLGRIAVLAGFFRAARRAHKELASGLEIKEPVLVAHSKASGNLRRPSKYELDNTDVVLNVADIARLSRRLGPNVELLEIPGGRHDLALSQKPARELYTQKTISWALRQTK